MRRGDIWTVSGGKDYAGKPRPVVIVGDDAFDATDSITICSFTTDPTEAPLFRLPMEPNERNGLRSSSRLMVDKITTVNAADLLDKWRKGCLSKPISNILKYIDKVILGAVCLQAYLHSAFCCSLLTRFSCLRAAWDKIGSSDIICCVQFFWEAFLKWLMVTPPAGDPHANQFRPQRNIRR
jgi:mRNA interferase MazF